MYTLWIRNTNDSTFEDMCIYNDESTLEEYKIESATLSLEEGSAGSLSMKFPITNDGYEFFELFATEITIKKKGAVYWMGRLLTSSEDFYANLDLKFEGIYNYLMDTVMPQYHFVGKPSKWARILLSYHNNDHASAGEYWKVIQPGTITFNDETLNEDFYSDYETTLDLVNNVCEGWKGHPTFRYEQRSYVDVITIVDGNETTERINYDKPYWNLILDINYEYDASANMPTITFGENLEDYTKENNVDELCTVVIPKGKAYDDDEIAAVVESFQPGHTQLEYQLPIEGLDYYRTIYRVDGTISLVTTDTDMLSRFGLVCKVVEFSDCEDCTELKALGQHYLQDQKWIGTTITIKAIDATLLGVTDVSEIKIGRAVKCYSEPHGLNHIYPCTGIEEDLLNPANTTFTLGIKDDKYMTDSSRQADEDLKELIIESRRKENLIKRNTNLAIENSYDDPTIWTNSELMGVVQEKVNTGISTAEIVATDDAKKNALTLLNIFDNELNDNNKGYVFFKKKNSPYTGPKLSIEGLKRRIKKYFNVSDDWFEYLAQYMNPSYRDGYMITVILGENDYETLISVHGCSPTGYGNGNPHIRNNSSKLYTDYYGTDGRFEVYQNYCFLSKSSTSYSIGSGGYDNIWCSADPTIKFSQMSNSSYYAAHTLIPNKATLDKSGQDGWYTVYVSYNIKAGPSDPSIYYAKNLYLTDSEIPQTYDDHIYEICISDQFDYMSPSANVWRWNKSGLYFIAGGYNETTRNDGDYGTNTDNLRVAITSTGDIVADRISVGKLDAGIIRAGYLTSQDYLVEHGGSGNPSDAHFVLDINNGIMMAKTGTLIFNNENNLLNGTQGSEKAGTSSFVYLSNLTTGELSGNNKGWMYVSGEKSRDWMMIIGSNFGIDKYGRAFMREGIIGATGGLWNLMFFNDDVVKIQWVQKTETTAEMQYKICINTTAARPVGAQVKSSDIYDSSKEQLICRWRLAKYDSNHNLVFYSPLYNLSPPAGNNTYQYDWSNFSTPITYTGTTEQAREHYDDIYYNGAFFPVYYSMDDVTESPDYTQDNHGFVLVQNHSGGDIRVTGGSINKPEYTVYSNSRYVPGILENYDSVRIGSGYLYCGTIGNDSSFSLNAINRSATVVGVARDDWRFTVGSRLGVTSNGTLYCNGAILNSVTAAGTISARTLDTNNVGGVYVNATHSLSGTVYEYTFSIRISYSYGINTAFLWLFAAKKTTGEGDQQILPQPDSSDSGKIPQTDFYGDIALKLTITAHFQLHGHPDVGEKVHAYEFVYPKNRQTGWTGVTDPLVIPLGNDDWTTDYPDSTQNWTYTYLSGVIEMTNEVSGENVRPTWTMNSSSLSDADSTATVTYGTFVVQKIDSDGSNPCVNIGSRDLVIGSGHYLGGPLDYVSHAYINNLHTSQSGSGSSRLYKEEIQPLTDIYDRIFDGLVPKSYYLKNDDRRVRHTGFILEDIGNMLMTNGISRSMFGAYSPNDNGFGGELYYLDFIALNTKQIQKLKRRIAELEERLDEVERNENSSNT